MNLPTNALRLIREYSKPLTHPYWRFGTPHALLINKSPAMNYMIRQIKTDLTKLKSIESIALALITKFGENIFDADQKYIQLYGEELIHFLYNLSYEPHHSNFYTYAKRYLNNILHLQLTIYESNNKFYFEYIYKKD